MKKSKFYSLITMVIIMTLIVTACSAKNSSFSLKDSKQEPEAPPAEYGASDYTSEETSLTNTSSLITGSTQMNELDKIIRKVNMEVETRTFDDLIESVNEQIKTLNGYVESSEISGRRYNHAEQYRYGHIVVRVPQENLDTFTNNINEIANVIRSQTSTENVTLEYIDKESHKKALQIEYDRLLLLLDKSDNLENIITLESRLSNIRYELQNYETQLRKWDNLVTYSTVNLNINEVERITKVSEKKVTVWSRINHGFSDTMYNISEGFKNFFVWFIVNLPYLIIWGVIITVIVIVINKVRKKKRQIDTIINLNPEDKDQKQ